MLVNYLAQAGGSKLRGVFLCPSKQTCFSLPHVRPIIRYFKLSFAELILMNCVKCLSNIQFAFKVSEQWH